MRTPRQTVVATYRVSARSTAQAIKIAEEYRRMGWRCSTRGKRIILTTYEEAYLSPITPILIHQMDRSTHEEAARQFLIPELRGPRESAGLEGEECDPGDEELQDDHSEGG